MNTFEYLSVFLSIVVGLGVVRVLGGLVTALDHQGRGAYWVHTAWIAYFILYLPYFWWFTFDWRHLEMWTLPVFLFVVAFSMLAYLPTAALIPDDREDSDDFEAYFFRIRPRFFTMLVLVSVADVVDTILKPGNLEDVGRTYAPVMTILILGHLTAAVSSNRRFHQIWVVSNWIVLLAFGFGLYADVFGGT